MELSPYILVIFTTLSFEGTDCVVYGMPVITYISIYYYKNSMG